MTRQLLFAVGVFAAGCGAEVPKGPVADVMAWTRGAVCYEVFVRSFLDSDGDGIGDLRGLTSRLDYINDGNPATESDLGASCIWLMPVAASPSYHGYDVSDYYQIEPDYGTAADFKTFVAEAHKRGVKVIVDMVLNHASSDHPSFQSAIRDTASPYRHWYRFSPSVPGKGPWGMNAWHRSPAREEFYYGVFWKGMPDLDYHTPAVREEAKKVATFWLREMQVDGFRLDAVPYLLEDGACDKNCPGTHAFLREYAAHIRSIAPAAWTVGEVWGPVDTLLPYYPDQLTAYFAFELADSLLAAVKNGRSTGVLDGFLRLQDSLPEYRWSPLLSNHDGTRTMTVLGGDVGAARLAATLVLTLPGLPFVYYGEEIGMKGDKPDEQLRNPMQWAPGKGGGFTTGTPWEALQSDAATVTVAAQTDDSTSLLRRYRRLIHLRLANQALAEGKLIRLPTSGPGIVSYLRVGADRVVLVIANLAPVPDTAASIGIPGGTLPPGRYVARELVGGPDGAGLAVTDAGAGDYRAGPGGMAPREVRVLELTRR